MEEGLPKFSLTKNQDISQGVLAAVAVRKREQEMKMEETDMTKNDQVKILNIAKKEGASYDEVAAKLGVSTKKEVNAIIDEVITKPNERKQLKKAFSFDKKVIAQAPTEAPLIEAPAEEPATVIEESPRNTLYNIVGKTEEFDRQLYALIELVSETKKESAKALSEIHDEATKIKKEGEKLKEDFAKEIDKKVKERIDMLFNRINNASAKINSDTAVHTEAIEEYKGRLESLVEEVRRANEALKKQTVKILIDLETGEYVTLCDELSFIDYNKGQKEEIYKKIINSEDPVYDPLCKRELGIVAMAKAIMDGREKKYIFEFADDEGNPLPEAISAAIYN